MPTMPDQKQEPASSVLPESLLAILVCPVDHAALRQDGDSLVCTACGTVYPIEDGIPNMLPPRHA